MLSKYFYVALDFWIWNRLRRAGLDEVTAADAMTEAVASVTLARPPRQRMRLFQTEAAFCLLE